MISFANESSGGVPSLVDFDKKRTEFTVSFVRKNKQLFPRSLNIFRVMRKQLKVIAT
jgi:hypothetical protein